MNSSQSTNYELHKDPIIQFCFFYFLLYLGGLILGGIGVFEIVFGLMIISTRILIRFPYFQKFTRRFFGFRQPEKVVDTPHSQIYRITNFVLSLLVLGFYAGVSLLLIEMGIKELLNNGFLNQNLFYILFFKVK